MTNYTGEDVRKVQEDFWVFDQSYAHLICTLSENMEVNPRRVVETFEQFGLKRTARLDSITSKIYSEAITSLEEEFKSKDELVYRGAFVPGTITRSKVFYRDLQERLQAG